MQHRLKNFLSLSALLLAACASTITRTIDRAAGAPELRNAIWGIDVRDDRGRMLYQRNAHTLLMPASNRKLFTASAAIDCHGLDHRFATELWLDGNNVVIRGTGDPSLGGRWAFDRDAVFATFIDALRGRGIQSVGDVIADPTLFDRNTIPAGWKVGNIGSDYAAPADALAYNENVAGVVIEHCEQPVIITDPSFVAATAHIACGSGDLSVRSEPNNGLQIEGVMAAPRDRSRRDRRSRAVCHGKRFAMSCAKRTSMCAERRA